MSQYSFHLVTHELCPYVQRSIITLLEKGAEYRRTDIDLANKPHWFAQASPLGKVPLLLIDNQHTLFESAVICEYIDEITSGSLHPSDVLDKAHHRAWIEFGSGILQNIADLYHAINKSDFDNALKNIQSKFESIEDTLHDTSFFAGEDFHLIDAAYGPIFRYFEVFEYGMRLSLFTGLPKCERWRQALLHRPSVQQAVSTNYSERLMAFVKNKGGYLSQLISVGATANA